MKTNVTVEVKDRKQATAIRRGLEIPEVVAFVIVVGILAELPSERARRRVIDFVMDTFAERDENAAAGSDPIEG